MTKARGIYGLALLWPLAALAGEPWTLERALQQALTANPDARLAQQRIVAAQAGLDQANAAFWPRVQFQSSYTGSDNPMQVFGSILNQRAYNYNSPPDFNDLPTVDNLNTRGLVTVPLYAGGKNVAARKAAVANTEAARQDNAAVRNALGFEVSRAFHTVLKTRQFVRAAEAAVSSLESSLGVARKRLDGGTLLKSGVLDIEVRLSQAREDLVRARNANALAMRALRNLLGVEQGDFEITDTAPAVTAPDSGDFSGRAELAAARHRERAAQEQTRAARGGYLPRLSAFGSLDYDYGWNYDHGGGSWTAGALLQWDLWDGKLTRAKVREANANLESAREEQRKLRLALDLEVEQARLDLKAADERLGVTEQAIAQATESARLTRARFEQELALPKDLIDAETALVAARVRRAEAEADRQIAIAALRKGLGLPQLESQTEVK
ncbi:MAG TPA: TolC family protein [Candidatus Paceibacterota bacterium]|nr:TolC family protein [Verrucomicrobiota bacterium]HSA09186.1 TolC family protein [Candidatus Paceibacterota bacterium]